MRFDKIRHVFFDLDHTLWDFDKNSALTFETIFREEEINVSLEDFLDAYIPVNNSYWELYRDNKVSKEALRTGRLKDSFELLKLELPLEKIEILADKYVQFLPGFNHLLKDTVNTLEYLQGRYRLHIITNGFEEVQHTKMKNSLIADFFDTVTTSEEAGVKKPHLKIFRHALEKAKALPENSVMVGDNYEADVLGAKNAGMRFIYFDYYQKKEDLEVVTINELTELKYYL